MEGRVGPLLAEELKGSLTSEALDGGASEKRAWKPSERSSVARLGMR